MEIKILFYLFLNCQIIFCQKCGTDFLKIKPGIIDIVNITNKRKLNDGPRPIKIKVDMTNIKNENNFQGTKYEILEEIFSEITDSFSSLISIIEPELYDQDFTEAFKQYCGIVNFDQNLKNPYKDFDLLIFPIISQLSQNVLAAATPCLASPLTYRPMAGIILINKDLSLSKNDFKYYMKNLLFHEVTHVLGFHPTIFREKGLYYNETIDNEERIFINSPKVLEKAKIHFGCDSIKGIRLENQGGEGTTGSHWESRYMLGDYMISSDYQEVVISDITLALLEDTGFYKANYYTGGLFRFGKNQGCAFLNKKCLYNKGMSTSFPNEFCLEEKIAFCTTSHLAKGNCYLKEYNNNLVDKYRYFEKRNKGGLAASDYCPVSYALEIDDNYYLPKNCNLGKKEYSTETIGVDSICFESSIFNNNKKINIYIQDNIIICPGYDTVLSNPNQLKGEIHCPDYNMVCTSDVWCNDIFDCIDKHSVADLNSYDYISNKNDLLKRDNNNLLVNDINEFENKEDNKENKNNHSLKIKLFLYYKFLFLLFINLN